MTDKIKFFYLHGTDPLFARVLQGLGEVFNAPRVGLLTVPGISRTTTWLDGSPRNDPFVNLLDPDIFEAVRVNYPAMAFPLGASIDAGIAAVTALINQLPAGQKFCLGGYSQGAAAMSSVYNSLRSGSLNSRNADLLGAVMMGNPRRQINYRGEVGGTWSGAWDVPGSTTGGHGSFPTSGPYARLVNCEPDRWIEMTTAGDIFSSTGDSTNGTNWVAANATMLTGNLVAILAAFLESTTKTAVDAATAVATDLSITDAVGKVTALPGGGHVAYAWKPPTGNPDGNLTAFQISVKWLEGKAKALTVGTDILPSTPSSVSTAGWTTTLTPPAA